MRRIEGVSDHAALGMLALRLANANRNARRTGGNDRIHRAGSVHIGVELDLEIRPLRPVFLDEVGFRERVLQAGSEAQPVASRAR